MAFTVVGGRCTVNLFISCRRGREHTRLSRSVHADSPGYLPGAETTVLRSLFWIPQIC